MMIGLMAMVSNNTNRKVWIFCVNLTFFLPFLRPTWSLRLGRKASSLQYSWNPCFSDIDARPWDFQAEECSLRANVDRFNQRRYGSNNEVCMHFVSTFRSASLSLLCFQQTNGGDYESTDNWAVSAVASQIELTTHFKRHYETWLEKEVLSQQTDWDALI